MWCSTFNCMFTPRAFKVVKTQRTPKEHHLCHRTVVAFENTALPTQGKHYLQFQHESFCHATLMLDNPCIALCFEYSYSVSHFVPVISCSLRLRLVFTLEGFTHMHVMNMTAAVEEMKADILGRGVRPWPRGSHLSVVYARPCSLQSH